MYDVAVIGAGPAGIAASIYLKRAGLDVTLFEKDEIGGLLLNAYLVENYPGFPLGIEGKQLCRLMKRHLKKWNIKPIKKEVKEVIIKKNSFILDTQGSENTFQSSNSCYRNYTKGIRDSCRTSSSRKTSVL
ncbi:MAG: NAD(P)/FAD-dependent oxidoreductase [Thermoplasmatales archaeon]|nr:NAD(P)/FAD-dependent oxidoreductase [Thermoplasmatales archaeon]